MAAPQNSLTNPQAFPTSNQQMPKEGPKCIPLGFSFVTAASYDVNLVNFMNLGRISIIQGMFVDNSTNPNSVIVSFQGTQQSINVKAYSQMYVPIFGLNPLVCNVSSTINANGVTYIVFYNVPIAPCNWDSTTLNNQGTLTVSDPVLAAASTGATLLVTPEYYSEAGVIRPKMTANTWVTAKITTAATTTLLTGNPGFFIDWLDVTMGPVAIIGAAAVVTFSLKDGATTIMQKDIYVPNAAANLLPVPMFQVGPGMGYISKGASTALTLVASTALTGGTISVNLGAAQTTFNT